jgi:hypothetical protein
MPSFPNLVLLDHYPLTRRHYQLPRVVEDEIRLVDLSFTLGDNIRSVALDRLAQTPNDRAISKATNNESLQTVVALIKFGRQETKVLNAILLQILQRYFQFDGSRSIGE